MKLSRYATAAMAVAFLSGASFAADTELWYMGRYSLNTDAEVNEFSNVVVRLAKNGYKAVTVNSVSACNYWDNNRREKFLEAKRICDFYGIEMIPSVWSLGYGELLSAEPNMAEGIKLTDIDYKVVGDKAVFAADQKEYAPKLQDIKLARKYAELKLPNLKRVRASGEFCTKGIKGNGRFRFTIRDKKAVKNDWFCERYYPCASTQDWAPFSCEFTVRSETGDCEIYTGFWTKEGAFDIRNFSIVEVAPTDALKGEGCPCSVKNALTGEVYKLGEDYADFRGAGAFSYSKPFGNKPIEIQVLPTGKIRNGDKLKVSFYMHAEARGSQVSVCPLHPKLKEVTEHSAKAIMELIHPKRWFIGINEYRVGGHCELCRKSGKNFGQLLGECVDMQCKVIRSLDSAAQVYIWSDMFDPTMNACKGFYNCATSVEKSWEYLPRDLGICVWDEDASKAEAAVGFFTGHGFPVMLASYYDHDEKDDEMRYTRRQVSALRRFTKSPIVMYSSWKRGNSKIEKFASAAIGSLDDLMPRPMKVEIGDGNIASGEVKNLRIVNAAVPGANEETADEAYILEITKDGITITASGRHGIIWAKNTLNQLVKLSGSRLPCCKIVDWPQFKWRGYMPDCGRNFMEVEHVKGMIDAMSVNKMNLFHWHLTEYYGWRLESKRYPELQKDETFYLRHIGKYYTQAEFKEIVDYAYERGVTVMPEFDIPGHALAFRRAFGFKTMRDDGVCERLCDLIDELCELAPAEKMPFIHLGSDEARLPEEKVPPKWMEPMARIVHAAGRTLVGWTPGELKGLEEMGPIVGMRWGRPKESGVSKIPFLDACGMYLDSIDPFELLGIATYRKVCQWSEEEGARLGGVACGWHDDFARNGFEHFKNQVVMPAFTLLGDAFWRGREDGAIGNGRWMPRGGDKLLDKARELERRAMAQRDRVWNDSIYPYHFLKQTDMRWRVTDGITGKVLADEVAQATMFMWQSCNNGVEDGRTQTAIGNITTNRSGVAIMETWIESPVTQEVGAWIGFTDFTRDHGRAYSAPTPDVGKWNRNDAKVELNGVKVEPPKWRKPGQLAGGDVTYLLYVHELDEKPFEEEEYYMRAPTKILLKKGWNHVKLTVPCKSAGGHAPWVATFIPMLGETDHPREVPGLRYSCKPMGDSIK